MMSGADATAQVFIGAAMGGTAEALGGGSFANGAITGAYVVLFNHLSHSPSGGDDLSKSEYPDVTEKFDKQLAATKEFFSDAARQIDELPLDPLSKKAIKLKFFYEMVKSNAPFDIKLTTFSNKSLEYKEFGLYNGESFSPGDFGNYNYGVAAKAFGLSIGMAKFGAGMSQIFSQNGHDYTNWAGYGDFRWDTDMIKRGYNH